jgi:uncharacterized protein (TIGR04255 family)
VKPMGARERMTWRPLHSQHAIERVRLIVQFNEQVPAKVVRRMSDALFALRHETRMTGPTSVQGFGFSMVQAEGGMIPQPQPVTNGWQFTRNASNNAPLEAVVLDGMSLTYETTEYQRWDAFKRRTKKVLDQALQIACESVDFQSISMEYIDRFMFVGNATEARVIDLLTDASPMLHPDAVSGKHLWHLHRGWFEDFNGGKILINQNFDAQEGIAAGQSAPTRSLQVLTKAESRADSLDLSIETYEENLETLHNLTKSYFKAAIVQTHHESLGLQ